MQEVVGSNPIGSIDPPTMRRTALKELYLHGNDALGLPAEVLGPTWGEAIAKHIELAKSAAIPGHHFRVSRDVF